MTDSDHNHVAVVYYNAPAPPAPQRQQILVGISGAQLIALIDTLP